MTNRASDRPAPVRIRLFAALRDLAGASVLEIDPEEASTVGALVESLSDRFGAQFARIAAAGSAVIDGAVAGPAVPLQPGQEVALLPPVSGGSLSSSPTIERKE